MLDSFSNQPGSRSTLSAPSPSDAYGVGVAFVGGFGPGAGKA